MKSNGTVEYLAEFKHKGELEVVVALGTNHFAVGFGTDGLEIYSFAEGKLGVKLTLNANSLNLTRINVVDLAYDAHRKLLFVL